ncbi:MAG: YfhO family protein [Candidatus Omnitrophica bacterium]|nr:YfhO family protein [Candidatus Omnitrophota bacterium]
MMNPNGCEIPRLGRRDLYYALALLAAVIAFNPSIAFEGQIPLDEDSLLFFYPLRALHSDPSVQFWDPYLFCGFPRDANPQSQILYFPNLLFLLVPPAVGYPALLIGHLFLGGALMYFLLRGLRLSPEAAFFGSLAFTVSTFWRCKITNLGLLEGISWMPGLLFYLLLSLETGSWVSRLTAGLFFSMVILAGVPHTVLYGLILLGIVTWLYSFGRGIAYRSSILTFFSITITAALLTMGMWLPAYLYLPETSRAQLDLKEALAGSIGWTGIWKVFLGGLAQPEISRLDPWEGTCYLGATALFFIPAGWMAMSKRLRRSLVALILVAVLCTLGPEGGLFPLLHKTIPGWNTINLPNRSLLLAALALPIFSAFGFQYLLNYHPFSCLTRYGLPFLALTGIAAAGFVTWLYPGVGSSLIYSGLTRTFQFESLSDGQWALLIGGLWLAVTALILALLGAKIIQSHAAALLFSLLVITQSAQYSQRLFLQTASPSFFDPPKSVRLLQDTIAQTGRRVCGFVPMIDTGSDVRMRLIQPSLMHRLPEVYRLPEIQGYDPLYPKRYAELLRAWAGHSRATDKIRTIRLERLPLPLLNFLGVGYVTGYPNQEVLFTGSGGELNGAGTLQSPLKTPREVESITFRWLCAGLPSIPQGVEIGKVHVHKEDQAVETFPVRMGLDIANYITEYPGMTLRHRPATEFRWFPVPSPAGYAKVRQYTAAYKLSRPAEIDKVSIDFLLPQGRFVVLEINLQTTNFHGLLRVDSRLESDTGLPVYVNPGAGPPVYLSRNIVLYDRLEEMINILETLEPGESPPAFFLRGEEIKTERPPIPQESPGGAILEYSRKNSDHFTLRTRSPYDEMLLVQENYSPNWNAMVDGSPVPVYRANHAFMAVLLNAGEHETVFHYFPRLFYYATSAGGCMLSLVILLLVLHPREWLVPRPVEPDSSNLMSEQASPGG